MRLRRFSAFSLVAACGVSLSTSGAGAVETVQPPPVVASLELRPSDGSGAAGAAGAVDAPAVVGAAGTMDAAAATLVDIGVAPATETDAPGPPVRELVAPPAPPAPRRAAVRVAQVPSAAADTLDFGTPPSGLVPILFNDHHVYAKPDELKRGRLLAALVRHGSIMVPVRSLFEALGATVSYDPVTRAIALRKRGVDVSLLVGKSVIVIDGELRPLDVPPEIVNGVLLVPIRVCSEAFGAFVQYVPHLHVVSIRYLAPTAPVPAPVPVVVATARPAIVGTPRRIVPPGPPIPKLPPGLETIVVVDTMVSPHVNNEFANNAVGPVGQNFALHGATEFDFLGGGFELDASYRQYRYAHRAGLVAAIDGGSTLVPAFVAGEAQLDAHAGVRLSPEKFYLVFGYASQTTRYGYPRVGGLGVGVSKLPAIDRRLSYEGSFVFYPNLSGYCNNVVTCPSGPQTLAYAAYRYSGGVTYAIVPQLFLEAGYQGDILNAKAGFPSNATHGSTFAGLGARF